MGCLIIYEFMVRSSSVSQSNSYFVDGENIFCYLDGFWLMPYIQLLFYLDITPVASVATHIWLISVLINKFAKNIRNGVPRH